MIGELIKIAVVIFVVMIGFAMSFHALFRDVDTFGQTFLTLFKGMLGEVGFFDDFPGDGYSEYEEVATALFTIYLVVIAIMLLNLLIAVLSTSHAKVQDKAEQEFRVSRALVIDYYRLVVDKHLLPPPCNLVQLLVCLPSFLVDCSWHGARCTRARQAIGRVVFWLVMGALAVVGGTVLWVMSAVYAPLKWHRMHSRMAASHRRFPPLGVDAENLRPVSIPLRYVAVCFWCVVVAPMYLVAFWVTAPLRWVELWPWTSFFFGREKFEHLERLKDLEEDPKCMHQMLRDCPGGLGVLELQEFLEDPMSDPQVRQDEKSRPTTVEHIKQLRDRIEKTNEANLRTTLKHVEREMARKPDHADARLARLEQDVVSLREEVICKMDIILEVMQESGARTASKCE